jgi:hypothetical protein
MGVSILLPLETVRGCRLVISVDARAKDVSKPAHLWNGIKAMLHVVTSGKADSWDQAYANGTSFPVSYDWTTLTFQTNVPRDAASATLVLGLQESSGEVDFRAPSVKIVRHLFMPAPVAATGPVVTGHGQGSLRGVMIDPPTLTRDDIETLSKWHVNLVRWQINSTGGPTSPADTMTIDQYDKWLNGSLSHLDEMMPYFKAAGIKVVIDMHTPPGGQNPNHIYRIFTEEAYQKHFGDLWEMIAHRYAGNTQVWGYDLVNEPMIQNDDTDLLDWHDLAEQTALRVRHIDHVHAIIVEPDPGGMVSSITNFAPLTVPGVVYSVHMYDPAEFCGQGVFDNDPTGPAYPGLIGNTVWNKDQIRKDFQPAIDYAKAYHVQIYVGEFSAIRWAKGADRWLSDVIDVMEENHWDWSYHAFREWEGWSVEVGDDKDVSTPSPTPTARFLVLQSAFAKNQPARGR